MDARERERRRLTFGRAVDTYDAIRPGYPDEAVHWALGEPDAPLVVADVGAGTGKLSRVVAGLGHTVIAVEPDAAMLARLREHLPDVDARSGDAEDPPLDDLEVDAFVAGQAWHWFDPQRMGAVLERVVRPGGVAAAIWNTRDASVDWIDRWGDLVYESMHPTGSRLLVQQGGPTFGDAFDAADRRTFRHAVTMHPQDLVDLAASRSHTIALPAAERDAMLDAVADLATTHPDLLGRDHVDMPYDTEVFRAARAG